MFRFDVYVAGSGAGGHGYFLLRIFRLVSAFFTLYLNGQRAAGGRAVRLCMTVRFSQPSLVLRAESHSHAT